ncbi:head decoration protein [Emticicia sp. BO119]|uniref:head decoration protein n=1 Tax=Emticicia sp. BO119 TaxID=2757768 RepID=UPI0015F038BC|nr:head decoration protein [Emticicia sp. BO119]MBA4851356.1 head decoration protein [Emticicia sp. BO119]
MATSKIKKRQIENLAIVDADVATGAAIATAKLADGANFIQRDGSVPFTANQDMGGFKITGLGVPASANDAVRLVDLQNTQAGLSGKESVRVATTANISLSGAQSIDGVSVVAGDRVLVKNQTTATQNGIYLCATGAWTRAIDADSAGELKAGSFVFVTEGTVNADSGWILSTDGAITIGSTAINWTQFSGVGQIIAGTGLTKSGNSIDIGTASASRIVVNADNIDLATSGASAGTYNSVTVDVYGRVTAGTSNAYITVAANRVTRETPAGVKNGTNTTFTLAFTPSANTEEVFLNGVLQEPGAGNDYTISGGTITMLTAPASDDKLVVCYFK